MVYRHGCCIEKSSVIQSGMLTLYRHGYTTLQSGMLTKNRHG